MKKPLLLLLAGFFLVSLSCGMPQAPMPHSPSDPLNVQKNTREPTTTVETVEEKQATATVTTAVKPTETAAALIPAAPASFTLDLSKPFAAGQLKHWNPLPYAVSVDALPLDLQKVANPGVIGGLTEAQRGALSQNGFTVLATHEADFKAIRDSVYEEQGQPYYLSTDAAYHALHVTFDEALKQLEREQLRPMLLGMTQGMLAQVQAYPAQGIMMEADTRLAAAYLAVAARLLDPKAQIPAELEGQVRPQIDQIMAGGGKAQSKLIPGLEDDYGAYKPVGHYAGSPELEAYFRSMTWYGRVAFKLKDPENPAFKPSRASLILTLTLRDAAGVQPTPAENWKTINEMINYLVGPSDDPGPVELSALMDTVYGAKPAYKDLADDGKWQSFLSKVDQLPAPQINSTFVKSTAALNAGRDWRLLGQRFTFDASIFQNLISDKVGSPDNQRKFPSGLDVMAVFGSSPALKALEESGQTKYSRYPEQMQKLQAAAQAQTESEWLGRFYTGWLYSFMPQLAAKAQNYPPYMRSESWGYKELNSALGSWAELKHDTVLYAKMPEFLGGGGPPSSPAAPAYLEANPDVFYRLAFITSEVQTGINQRLSGRPAAKTKPSENQMPLDQILHYLGTLAEQYQAFGDMAAAELAGQPLTQDDYDRVETCLGIVECYPRAFPDPKPLPVIAAVSGADDQVLEVGVGPVDRIYVAVPINGTLQVAQGGVFSYYEFLQPRDNRLTDEDWVKKLQSNPPPDPAYRAMFILPGGAANAALTFRVHDWYYISEAGGNPPLNLRAEPSKSASVLLKLQTNDYIEIIDGPVTQDGATWWKVQPMYPEGVQGWVMENPDWYKRAHPQE